MPQAFADWRLEDSPCEVGCPHVARCRQYRLACVAFESFVSLGGRCWRSELREPTDAAFAKIYALAEGETAKVAA